MEALAILIRTHIRALMLAGVCVGASTWLGDSIGRCEGDTFVVDTVGFNDKTWLDHVGHPHSDALHVIERFRHVNPNILELTLTVDDPKAYTKSMTGKKHFTLSTSPMGETIGSTSEMESFEKEILDPTTKPLKGSAQCY